ncbi:MAG: hypothetical protein IPL26_00235 [Leptospiraceae bacterium]|nr:hypothetical protein [Leptospiraceae bacterium]
MNETKYNKQSRPLKSFEDTVKEIERLGKTYWTDLLLYPEICQMSPYDFFCFVKSLKYIADPKGEEYVTRPGHTLNFALSGNGHYFDCDDRTVLTISYFTLRNKLLDENNKMKIIVSGRNFRPHHVYCDVNGLPFDPTYPYNVYQKVLFPEGFRREYPIK